MSTSTTFLLEIPRAQQLATGSGKVRQLAVLLNHRQTRISLVDIAILILKLIVAALQLLDAVLKYLK